MSLTEISKTSCFNIFMVRYKITKKLLVLLFCEKIRKVNCAFH